MSCTDCESAVEEALEGVSGIRAARADHEADMAVVDGDADPLDLIAAVTEAGYEADTV